VLRLFLALNFLLINLYACNDSFRSCKSKIRDSKSIQKDTLQIPVLKNKRLIFSKNIPNKKIIKYDPFLSLYLVEDKKSFKYPFRINNKLSLGTATVTTSKAIKGRIVKHQIGLSSFAKYNKPVYVPSLLLNSCCSLEGIVSSRGIIEKEYIERFLKVKTLRYSDIGIRVRDEKNFVIVKESNPFIKKNLFKKGDCILKFDGKKVKNSASLMRKILFSKIGSGHKVQIKRNKEIKTFKIKSQKRYGGGYLSDTFLEQRGLFFDKKLRLTSIQREYKSYGLHLGDKLLKVNSTVVNTQKDVRDNILKFDEFTSLLFERNDFQFFININ